MSTKKIFNTKTLQKKYGELTVARFLSSWRKAEQLSQKDFAKLLQISATNLCDLEKGRKRISISKAVEIARIIGFSATLLVQLAMQEEINKAGLKFSVEIKSRVA